MAIVGSAEVHITADVSGLAKSIETQLRRAETNANTIGENIGKKMKSGINSGMGDMSTVLDGHLGKFEDKGERAGARFGRGFVNSSKMYFAQLAKALGELFGEDFAKETNAAFKNNVNFENAIVSEIHGAAKRGSDILADYTESGIAKGAKRGSASIESSMRNSGRRGGRSYGSGFMWTFEKIVGFDSPAPFEGMIKGILGNLVPLQVMQGIIVGVVGAVSSLVSAFVALGSSVAASLPALLAAVNVFGALGQAGIVLGSIFKGIGEGMSAYTNSLKAQKKASSDTKKSQLDEAERLLRIKAARLALADAIMDGARANADAIERVTDAQEDYEDALEAVRDAEEDLTDAMRDEEKAYKGINKAREEAQERLEDLRLELSRASLNEERAALNLRDAEEELARARAGGNTRAIQEADLAYREQLQSVAELAESNGDLRDEANDAQVAGVDGAQEVIEAQEDYTDAIEATADAQEALRDAVEGVSDAQRELQRAIQDVPRVAADAAMRIAQAQLALQRALLKAKPAADATKTAMDNLRDAFDKLSPAAQDFVRFMVNKFLPAMGEIKKAGQEKFFPKLQAGLQGILDDADAMDLIKDAVEGTASALGTFAQNILDAFHTDENLKNFRTIIESNTKILENLGAAAVNLVRPLGQIFAATAPLAEAWSKSVEKATERFSNWINGQADAPEGEDSPLVKFFEEAAERIKIVWDIIKNIASGIGGIFKAALPAGDEFLIQLQGITDLWATDMNKETTKNSMADTFMGAKDNAVILLGLIGDIIGVLFRLGANPAIGMIAQAIRDVIPIFETLSNDALDQVAGAIVRIIKVLPKFGEFFTKTGTIKTFVDLLASAAEWVGKILDFILKLNDMSGGWLLKVTGWVTGAYLAFKLFYRLLKTPISGAVKKIGAVGTAMRDVGRKAADGARAIFGFFKRIRAGSKAAKFGESSALAAGQSPADAKAYGKQRRREVKAIVQADLDEKQIEKENDRLIKKMDREINGSKIKQVGREAGRLVIQGLEWGLEEGVPKVTAASKRIGNAAIDGLKFALRISSPSKEAEEEGEWTWKGYVNGLNEGVDNVFKAAESLASAAIRGLSGGEAKANQQGDQVVNAYVRGLRGDETQAARATESVENAAVRGLNGGEAQAEREGDQKARAFIRGLSSHGAAIKAAAEGIVSTALLGLAGGESRFKAIGEAHKLAYASGLSGPVAGPTPVFDGGVGGGTPDITPDVDLPGDGDEDGKGKGKGKRGRGKGGAILGLGDDVAAGVTKNTGKIGKALGGLGKVFKPIATVGKVAGKGLLAFLGPVGAVIGALWLAVDVLGMFGISFGDIMNFFRNFSTEAPKVWDKVVGAFKTAVEKIKEWFGKLIPWLWETYKEVVPTISKWFFFTFLPFLATLPFKIQVGIWNWVLDQAEALPGRLSAFWNDTLKPWFADLPRMIGEAVANFWGMIFGGDDSKEETDGALDGMWNDSIKPFFVDLPKRFADLGITFFNWIVEEGKELPGKLDTWWNDTVVPWFQDLPSKIKQMGVNILQGLMGADPQEGKKRLNALKKQRDAEMKAAKTPEERKAVELKFEVKKKEVISDALGTTEGLDYWWETEFKPWLKDLPTKIKNLGIDIWGWIIDAAKFIVPRMADWWWTEFLPWVLGLPKKLLDLQIDIWGWILQMAWKVIPGLVNWWATEYIPWLLGLPKKLLDLQIDVWGWVIVEAAKLIGRLAKWWATTYVPWVLGLPGKLNNLRINIFGWVLDRAADLIKGLDRWITEKLIPWLAKLSPLAFSHLAGFWDGFKSGIVDAWNAVARIINNDIIPALNKLPFLEITTRMPYFAKNTAPGKQQGAAGMADGGFVPGPDRGPRADNVMARLTPGEFVVSRRMVDQIGPEALAQWHKTGEVPGVGGFKDWVKAGVDFVVPDKIDEWMKKGAGYAFEKVLMGALSLVPDQEGFFAAMKKYILEHIDVIRKFGEKVDEKAAKEAAKNAQPGAPIPPYNGPPGGWTQPLGRNYEWRTRRGHSPGIGAYDIGGQLGEDVRSVSAGVVASSYWGGGNSYGNVIVISHRGAVSRYAHLVDRIAKSGQTVRTGQLIGRLGSTGNSTAPHLHFELNFPKNAAAELRARGVKGIRIRPMAAGGTIAATPGGVLAMLAEGGRSERVTPLDNQGRSSTEVEMLEVLKGMATQRGGDTFQVFPAPGMNERELAVKVSREVAFQHRRRA